MALLEGGYLDGPFPSYSTRPGLQLAPHHDTSLYARIFNQFGRLHIPNLLRPEDAEEILAALSTDTPWSMTVIHDALVYDVAPDKLASMTDEEKSGFEAEVNQFASRQYEGRYHTVRLSDHGEPYEGKMGPLRKLTVFLNGSEFLNFARQVTGIDAIRFADAQATAYGTGDFLHRHNDVLPEKKRLAAYVINLTPRWKPEWGGLLNFLADDEHVAEAYTPAWNALNIFRLEQPHFVGCVAPFAPVRRYSVTGWLRTD